MKRILLLSITLLLSIAAVKGVYKAEEQHAQIVYTEPHAQSAEQAEVVSFNDDQLLEAVPQKTPRTVITLRRRYFNTTLDFFPVLRFYLPAFGRGVGQKLLTIGYSVFNLLGGEAAFLFRLTPF